MGVEGLSGRLSLRPRVNPILIKELRGRMRGARAFLILTGFLVLLGLASYILYQIGLRAAGFSGIPQASAAIGVSMFMGLAFFELSLILFLTPALTAPAVSSEHESLTYEMLMATPLGALSIFLGKLIAALSYVFLLIFATIPLMSLVFIFGGVTPRDITIALGLLVATTVLMGVIGMFWSALLGRTTRATVASYLTLAVLVMGPTFLGVLWSVSVNNDPPPLLWYANPFSALASVIAGSDPRAFGGEVMGLFNLFSGRALPGFAFETRPLWHWTLALYGLASGILTLVTIPLMRPRRRPSAREVAIGALLIVAMLAGLATIFEPADFRRAVQVPDQWRDFPLVEPLPLPAPPAVIIEREVIIEEVIPVEPEVLP